MRLKCFAFGCFQNNLQFDRTPVAQLIFHQTSNENEENHQQESECDECRDNWVNINIEFQLLLVMETDKQLPGPMNTDSSEISHYFRYSVSSNSQWQRLSSVLPITTSQCSRSNKNLKFSNNYCLLSSNHFVSLQIIF